MKVVIIIVFILLASINSLYIMNYSTKGWFPGIFHVVLVVTGMKIGPYAFCFRSSDFEFIESFTCTIPGIMHAY